jgi:hypothetical protein
MHLNGITVFWQCVMIADASASRRPNGAFWQLASAVLDCWMKPSDQILWFTAEIRLSISILGETLGQILHSIRHSFEPRGPGGYIDVRNKWGYNRPLLHKLLLE